MKLATLFISLIWTISSSGQSLEQIKQLLADNDFAALEKFIDTASARYNKAKLQSNMRAICRLKRDLTPSFQESTVDIDESFPDEEKPGVSIVYRYRVNLISTSTQIIYYDFAEKASRSLGWDDFELEILDSFRNKGLTDSLKASFFRTYGTQLNWKELFEDRNVYGFACSIDGEMPFMRQELLVIVSKKNYQLLNEWLKSANAERQIYAIEGLYQLKRKGYKLTQEQTRLISVVLNKKGKANICRGCIYSSDSISEIVKGISKGRKI